MKSSLAPETQPTNLLSRKFRGIATALLVAATLQACEPQNVVSQKPNNKSSFAQVGSLELKNSTDSSYQGIGDLGDIIDWTQGKVVDGPDLLINEVIPVPIKSYEFVNENGKSFIRVTFDKKDIGEKIRTFQVYGKKSFESEADPIAFNVSGNF